MKRITFSMISIVMLVSILVLPVYAGATNIHYSFPLEIPFIGFPDPCTGDPIDALISGTFDVHEVYDKDGYLVRVTSKMRGTLSATDPTTGATTSGPLIWNFSESGNADGPHTYVYNARIASPGPGNNILLVSIWHDSSNGMSNMDNVQLDHVCLDQPGNQSR